ncbi:protein POLLEN DEFECTIVE IN GUIDANCE 1-like isoform X2 [Aristolochia californica]|uniref:protein POLLEN DEFECTIVE IN GUIDANCE 1-like isoform X2 n=1 Tax=Aristolochia californica TaxID=171875 RepID=UPI0035DE3EFC
MAVRAGGRKLSFDLLNLESPGDDYPSLHRSCTLPIVSSGEPGTHSKHKSGRRKRKKKSTNGTGQITVSTAISNVNASQHEIGHCNLEHSCSQSNGIVAVGSECGEPSYVNCPLVDEMRHKSTNGRPESDLGSTIDGVPVRDESGAGRPSSSGWRPEWNGVVSRLETTDSLDWNRLMAESSDLEKLSLKYLMGEIAGRNSLRMTTSVGNEKKRQKVYNTMFHVPWRCELLIDVGFFVCLDSFLSLLTIMPARIFMAFWRFLSIRQFQRPSDAELSDFGCFIVLFSGVAVLEAIDISLIYHIIRGQGTIKLYVLYNVLEIFDKLCQSFGGDALQVLFNSAEGIAGCSKENMNFELTRFILDQTIAVMAFIVHSFILLAQAITLSTCIVAHNNALLALLVSNNFAEIKSSVFKRFSKDNLHSLVYFDVVERFHIFTFLSFVLAQYILEAEGSWFGSFLFNAFLVIMCEMVIDVIKHSFLAKFNEIKPAVYSEFLEDLCKQTLNMESDNGRKNLTFVPIAPACVVIRVLSPIYAEYLPLGQLPRRLVWILFLSAITYIVLLTLKIVVGLSLHLYASWSIGAMNLTMVPVTHNGLKEVEE